MFEYIYLNERKNYGSIAISTKVVVQVVTKALREVEGVSLNEEINKRHQFWRLSKKVNANYRNGIVHIIVKIDLASGKDIQQVTAKIQEAVENNIYLSIGHIPFDIAVNVERIIDGTK